LRRGNGLQILDINPLSGKRLNGQASKIRIQSIYICFLLDFVVLLHLASALFLYQYLITTVLLQIPHLQQSSRCTIATFSLSLFHLVIRVRYGDFGSPKNAGPRPISPPRPAQWPGAGPKCWHSLPLSPPGPPPHPPPRRVPLKILVVKNGARPGNEGEWAPDGGRAGITQTISPPGR